MCSQGCQTRNICQLLVKQEQKNEPEVKPWFRLSHAPEKESAVFIIAGQKLWIWVADNLEMLQSESLFQTVQLEPDSTKNQAA